MRVTNFVRMLLGAGSVAPPSPGNRNNAYFPPPVQSGNYQWIPQNFINGVDGGKSLSVSAPYHVPPAYRDWGKYGVAEMDLSGLAGGGIAEESETPEPPVAGSLFFDPQTGLYYTMDDPNG